MRENRNSLLKMKSGVQCLIYNTKKKILQINRTDEIYTQKI